jgi:hypothetical protein
MSDDSMTGTFRLSLPQELLTEASRHYEPKPEMLRVEGWRTSWLSRLAELLLGKE